MGFVPFRITPIVIEGFARLRNTARSLFLFALFVFAPSVHTPPDGEGKVLIEAVCGTCRSPHLIERSSGYTREDWKALAATMIDLSRNRVVH